MFKTLLALYISLLLTTPAFAEIRVVATLPWIGSLAKEIGRDRITVTTLVKPTQDPHMVEAKPSMISAGRRADILMYNGLDLEVGYLSLIMESSKNRRIMPGRPGNFDCSRFVRVLDKQANADRSMGDVHPLGNPHYHFAPSNISRIAEGMTLALSELDPPNASFYRANQKNFSTRLSAHRKQWKTINLKGKKFIAYHKLFEYLAADFGFHLTGYVEAKPGIPPSAAHMESLAAAMKRTKPDGILTTSFYGKRESQAVSARTGIKTIVLAADVGDGSRNEDWFGFMDRVLASLK